MAKAEDEFAMARVEAVRALRHAFGDERGDHYAEILFGGNQRHLRPAIREHYFNFITEILSGIGGPDDPDNDPGNPHTIPPMPATGVSPLETWIDEFLGVDEVLEAWAIGVGPNTGGTYHLVFLGIVTEEEWEQGVLAASAGLHGPPLRLWPPPPGNPPDPGDIYQMMAAIAWHIHRRFLSQVARRIQKERRAARRAISP
jgi:hypothetical protein